MASKKEILEQIDIFYKNNPEQIGKKDKVTFRCCENMFKEVQKIDSIRAEEDGKEHINALNGVVVLKENLKDGVCVILSNCKMREAQKRHDVSTWKGTVHHEYTHAHDFLDFIDYFECETREETYENQCFTSFKYWTEFHARKIGYIEVWNIVHPNLSEHDVRKNISAILREPIKRVETYIGTEIEIYELMQFCGRCSALNSKYPKILDSVDIGIANFHSVFQFLEERTNFESMKESFGDFKLILDNL